MNAREQLLKKRVESLEGQIGASLELLGRVLEENEYLASVACGFAWDLVTTHRHHWVGDEVAGTQLACWNAAVQEASK